MRFEDLIESIRSRVNHKLENMPLPVYPEYLYDPIRYSIVNKGKRFRAILTHLTGRANKIDSKASGKKIGRNEPCFCGSGKKYKHCCGAL